MRMLLRVCKQACNTVGLQELAVRAGCRNGALERRAEQRVIIDDEDFVSSPLTPTRFSQHPRLLRATIVISVSSNCDPT